MALHNLKLHHTVKFGSTQCELQHGHLSLNLKVLLECDVKVKLMHREKNVTLRSFYKFSP